MLLHLGLCISTSFRVLALHRYLISIAGGIGTRVRQNIDYKAAALSTTLQLLDPLYYIKHVFSELSISEFILIIEDLPNYIGNFELF